jgi:hypothetical protein
MSNQFSLDGPAVRTLMKCLFGAAILLALFFVIQRGLDEPISFSKHEGPAPTISEGALDAAPHQAQNLQSANRSPKSEKKEAKPVSGLPDVYASWKKFPRGLGATATQTIEERLPDNAVLLALQVKGCMVIDDVIDEDTKSFQRVERFEVERSANLRAKLESYVSIKQDCSTLPTSLMEQKRLRDKLFAVASEAGVVGAAAAAGPYNTDSPNWRQALLRDAQAGDLESMALVARLGVQFYGLSEQEARAYAYAVLRAQDNWEAAVVSRARIGSEMMLTLARIEFSTAMTGDSRESAWLKKVIPDPQYSEPTDPRLIQLGKQLDKAMLDLEKERASVGRYGVKRTGS